MLLCSKFFNFLNTLLWCYPFWNMVPSFPTCNISLSCYQRYTTSYHVTNHVPYHYHVTYHVTCHYHFHHNIQGVPQYCFHFSFLNFSTSKTPRNSILNIFQQPISCRFWKYPIFYFSVKYGPRYWQNTTGRTF